MQVNIDTKTIKSALREAGAVAAVVVGDLQSVPLPSSARGFLIAAGGLVLAVEHGAAKIAPAIQKMAANTQTVTVTPTAAAKTPSGPPAVD